MVKMVQIMRSASILTIAMHSVFATHPTERYSPSRQSSQWNDKDRIRYHPTPYFQGNRFCPTIFQTNICQFTVLFGRRDRVVFTSGGLHCSLTNESQNLCGLPFSEQIARAESDEGQFEHSSNFQFAELSSNRSFGFQSPSNHPTQRLQAEQWHLQWMPPIKLFDDLARWGGVQSGWPPMPHQRLISLLWLDTVTDTLSFQRNGRRSSDSDFGQI